MEIGIRRLLTELADLIPERGHQIGVPLPEDFEMGLAERAVRIAGFRGPDVSHHFLAHLTHGRGAARFDRGIDAGAVDGRHGSGGACELSHGILV